MIKYLEILDESIWEEEVAVGFPSRSYIDEDENEIVYKYNEYFVKSGSGGNNEIILRDNEEVPNVIKRYMVLNKGGKQWVNLPSNFSNPKLKEVPEREVEVYRSSSNWLIHLSTDFKPNTDPKNIDWVSQTEGDWGENTYKWKGDIVRKTLSIDGNPVIEKVYSAEYNPSDSRLKTKKIKEFYWYRVTGEKVLLKTKTKALNTYSTQFEDYLIRVKNSIVEAIAFTKGTELEPFADAFLEAHRNEYNDSVVNGTTAFLDALLSATQEEEAWLFYPYSTSHLYEEHIEELPENPTIQDALNVYLGFMVKQ